MKKCLILFSIMTITATSSFAVKYYGQELCKYPQFECIKASGSWEKMFPDPKQRDIVQRLNRTYNYLWGGKTIVVPKNLKYLTLFDVAPFPLKIKSEGEKQVIVDQDKLAWVAYDKNGNMVHWGPIASGSNRCSDNSSKTCLTMTGIFRFFSKENEHCKSGVFPIGRGGAKMPYCMYFHKGFAMHGSHDIPGYRASHGCVRMFTRDAKWMNHYFVDLSNEGNDHLGTKVTIRPVTQ
ncbi:L,D-transpeptidase [Legionella sp. W05-934-2]|uniref:L,D-transpeptidase n=1 Tax=Legionella sp. W05-934-2 TaxID=1198649 RepID=UPI0034623859